MYALHVQADLPYDSDVQSSHLQEVLNTSLEVETGLEASSAARTDVCDMMHSYLVFSEGTP